MKEKVETKSEHLEMLLEIGVKLFGGKWKDTEEG
jgi:hypothetical protein